MAVPEVKNTLDTLFSHKRVEKEIYRRVPCTKRGTQASQKTKKQLCKGTPVSFINGRAGSKFVDAVYKKRYTRKQIYDMTTI